MRAAWWPAPLLAEPVASPSFLCHLLTLPVIFLWCLQAAGQISDCGRARIGPRGAPQEMHHLRVSLPAVTVGPIGVWTSVHLMCDNLALYHCVFFFFFLNQNVMLARGQVIYERQRLLHPNDYIYRPS